MDPLQQSLFEASSYASAFHPLETSAPARHPVTVAPPVGDQDSASGSERRLPPAPGALLDPAMPVCLDTRAVSAADIAAINQHHRFRGARAYDTNAEAAARQAEYAQSAVRSRLRSWIWHPDARVPMGLARNAVHLGPWTHHSGADASFLADTLYQRAMADAAVVGAVWTPLLDTLAASGRWPRATHVRYDDGTEIAIRQWACDATEVPAPIAHVALDAALARVRPFVQAATDPRLVESLLQFRCPELLTLVAGETRALDAALVAAILVRDHLLALPLAENPHLTPGLARQIAEWAVSRLESLQVARPRRDSRDEAVGCTVDAFRALVERGLAGDPDHRDRLLALVSPLAKSATTTGYTGDRGGVRNAAFTTLLSIPNLELAHLEALYERVQSEPQQVLRVLGHPAVPLALCRRIAQEVGDIQVREFLADTEALRRDPTIRAVLYRSRALRILFTLCLDAEPEEFRRLFARLSREAPVYAVELLEQTPPVPQRACLGLDDLRPLMEGKHVTLRCRIRTLFAIRTMGWGAAGEHYFRQAFPVVFAAYSVGANGEGGGRAAIELLTDARETLAGIVAPDDLACLLADKNPEIRMAAIGLAWTLPLAPARTAEAPDVTSEALRALAAETFPALITTREHAAVEFLTMYPEAVDRLLDRTMLLPLLKSRDSHVRQMAIAALAGAEAGIPAVDTPPMSMSTPAVPGHVASKVRSVGIR